MEPAVIAVLGSLAGIVLGWGLRERSERSRRRDEYDQRWDRDRMVSYAQAAAAFNGFELALTRGDTELADASVEKLWRAFSEVDILGFQEAIVASGKWLKALLQRRDAIYAGDADPGVPNEQRRMFRAAARGSLDIDIVFPDKPYADHSDAQKPGA